MSRLVLPQIVKESGTSSGSTRYRDTWSALHRTSHVHSVIESMYDRWVSVFSFIINDLQHRTGRPSSTVADRWGVAPTDDCANFDFLGGKNYLLSFPISSFSKFGGLNGERNSPFLFPIKSPPSHPADFAPVLDTSNAPGYTLSVAQALACAFSRSVSCSI